MYRYKLEGNHLTCKFDEQLNFKNHGDIFIWQFNCYVKNDWYFRYSSLEDSCIILSFKKKTSKQIIRLFKKLLGTDLDEEIRDLQIKREQIKNLHYNVVIEEDISYHEKG